MAGKPDLLIMSHRDSFSRIFEANQFCESKYKNMTYFSFTCKNFHPSNTLLNLYSATEILDAKVFV
jgi:hypothetical protein